MGVGTYIKLFRKFKNWQWYKDPVTKSLFIHFLIEARWADTNMYGVAVKKGQLLTTEKDLEEELGLTRQQIRTGMNHLIATKEITKVPTKVSTKGATNRMSLITVENYGLYQKKGLVVTEDSTEGITEDSPQEQPRANQASIILKNDKESFNKDIKNSAHLCAREEAVDNSEAEESSLGYAFELEEYIRRCEAEGKKVNRGIYEVLELRRKREGNG